MRHFRIFAAGLIGTVLLAAPVEMARATDKWQGAYCSLQELAAQKGLDFFWDPIARNATVSGPLGFARFHAGSEYFLSEGKLDRLPDKVYFSGDNLLAPPAVAGPLDRLSRPLKVVIDAGHGGRDFGAITRASREKKITLEIARDVAEELKQRGVRVFLTRDSDRFIELSDRASFAGEKGADLFVSIHANASTTPGLEGFEVYYLSPETNDYFLANIRSEKRIPEEGKTLLAEAARETKAVYWDLRQADNRAKSMRMAGQVVDGTRKLIERGSIRVRPAQFYVLKWTECPAVLVEVGYLTNRREEKKLGHSVYQKKLAKSIAEGLINYKKNEEKMEGRLV